MSKVFQVFALVMSLAPIGVMGAFSPLMAVKAEKVAIVPKDEDASIPDDKKAMKITLKGQVKALKVSKGSLPDSPAIRIIDAQLDSLKKVNGDKTVINQLNRLRLRLLKHTEEASGSGKNWSVKIERLRIGEFIRSVNTKKIDDSTTVIEGPVRHLTIEWTDKDDATGTTNITLNARAKIVTHRDDTLEYRVISVSLISQ